MMSRLSVVLSSIMDLGRDTRTDIIDSVPNNPASIKLFDFNHLPNFRVSRRLKFYNYEKSISSCGIVLFSIHIR